jgi:oligopeptide transport system permease protein
MRLLLARLGWTAAILLLVASGSFFLVRLVPGGPFDQEKVTDPVIRANLLAAYDMDAPLGVQYLHYLRGLAHGDFGPSLRYRDYSVNQILAESLPISACSARARWRWRCWSGCRRARWPRRGAARGWTRCSWARPRWAWRCPASCWRACWCCVRLRLATVPGSGYGSPAQLVLPAIALGLPFAASIARLFRAGCWRRWARTGCARRAPRASRRARCCGATRRGWRCCRWSASRAGGGRHPLGSLVVERIFAIAGMGSHFVDSAFNADYNLARRGAGYTRWSRCSTCVVDLAYGCWIRASRSELRVSARRNRRAARGRARDCCGARQRWRWRCWARGARVAGAPPAAAAFSALDAAHPNARPARLASPDRELRSSAAPPLAAVCGVRSSARRALGPRPRRAARDVLARLVWGSRVSPAWV